MRKLASVQIIKEIKPIENADSIEIAKVEGWNVVVKKGEFKPGDYVVYCEIDSFLPIEPQYEFLRASSYKNSPILGEGFKLKTVRLRGVYSQGLILPISVVEEKGWVGLPEGTDVSETLGIRKWEEPEMAIIGGQTAGKRPDFIKKTDETRIQNLPGILKEFGECEGVYATVKIDGSSHSAGIDSDDNFRITSHNLELKKEPNKGSFYDFLVAHDIEKKLKDIKKEKGLQTIVVQGEWAGPGIQKNKLGLAKPNWYIFTVDFNGERQGLKVLREVAEKLGVDMVPVVEEITGKEFLEKYPDAETLLARVEGNDSGIYKGQQEGWVIRPTEPRYSETIGGDLSIKVINNKYLLKNS